MSNNEPPVYRAAYELTLMLFRWAKDCPKDYQPSLGFLVQEEAIKLESALCHCQEAPDKPALLQKALGSCFLIRLILRLLLDLGFVKIETSVAINLKIDDVANQLSGWRKSLLASA